MKICPQCSHRFAADDWTCSSCGYTPGTLNSFFAFAPELADSEAGFFPDAHETLDQVQHKSFWFRSRNRLIQALVRRYCSQATSVLEIGCGTGYVLAALGKVLPKARLSGSELDTAGLAFAAKRLEGRAEFFQMDARVLPFQEEFDLIAACDVLEHIEDDGRVLQEMHKAVKLGGFVLLTVPQHPFLWSATDERACHKRRYRVHELADKVRQAGFSIVVNTSFVFTLLPVMLMQRRTRGKQGTGKALQLPFVLDRFFEFCLRVEIWMIEKGIRLPFGGSRVVLARKR